MSSVHSPYPPCQDNDNDSPRSQHNYQNRSMRAEETHFTRGGSHSLIPKLFRVKTPNSILTVGSDLHPSVGGGIDGSWFRLASWSHSWDCLSSLSSARPIGIVPVGSKT